MTARTVEISKPKLWILRLCVFPMLVIGLPILALFAYTEALIGALRRR